MEWLVKFIPALTTKAAGGLWKALMRRVHGDTELASNFRLDIVAIHEDGPAVLRLKAIAPMEHIEVRTIRVITEGDWVIRAMGEKLRDGRHFAADHNLSPELVVNLSVTDMMKAQGPYADGSFSFLAGFQVMTPSQDGQTTRNFGRLLQSSHGTSITRFNEIQIEATLSVITDNRRETFIRLKTQPVAQAIVVPASKP